jgi:ADP-heptose:LPS heptosyltransferase
LQHPIKNILIINTGGGIGDAIQFIKIFKLINQELKSPNIDYYACDMDNFWFENKLSSLKIKNVQTIKHFPIHFGFRLKHFFNKKIKNEKFYDLIIDNQSRYTNTLIYKRIPHKYFLSFSLRGMLSQPMIFKKKHKHVQLRVINYLEKFLNKKIDLNNIQITISQQYHQEANRLLDDNKKYIGFSIKAGHKTRIKEFELMEIVKTAQYFVEKNFTPVFFIEPKYEKEINIIKKNIISAYFPEHLASSELKNPSLVIAIANKMAFNITIDNGVMHMLTLANPKLFAFFNKSSDKFKPIKNNSFVYDCEKNKETIDNLDSQKIIEFIERNI